MHLETDFRYFDFDPGIALAGLTDWLGADPHSVMFVADDDGDVVGMLGATVRSTWFGRHKFASEELFYVTPAHRGSGAAKPVSPPAAVPLQKGSTNAYSNHKVVASAT